MTPAAPARAFVGVCIVCAAGSLSLGLLHEVPLPVALLFAVVFTMCALRFRAIARRCDAENALRR